MGMRIFFVAFAFAAVLPVRAAETQLEASPATALPAAPLADIVIGGFDQPLRVRLVVTYDGQPWRQYFEDRQRRRVQSLFGQLDADGDGRLSPAEAKRLPQSRTLGGRQANSEVNVAFNFLVLDADRDGFATREELAAYAAGFGNVPFRIAQATEGRPAKSIDLFTLLDADKDGRLTEKEWSNAEALLERDRDGNRVLTADELTAPSADVFGPEFVATPLDRSASQRPLTFAAAAPTPSPADVVVAIRFSDSSTTLEERKEPLLRIALSAEAEDRGLRGRVADGETIVLSVGRQRVELRIAPPVVRRDADLRQAIVREFGAVAERLHGNVTAGAELPPLLKAIFPLADGNADGRLEWEEVKQCLDGFVVESLAAEMSRLRLTVLDQRRGLMALVDRNLDGRLSRRELSLLPTRLAGQAGPSGVLTREDLPATTTLVLQRGPFDEAVGAEVMLNAGPPWFFHADRNNDGDLDESEFLGPAELFRRLDMNGDGWLDLREAIAGDELFAGEAK